MSALPWATVASNSLPLAIAAMRPKWLDHRHRGLAVLDRVFGFLELGGGGQGGGQAVSRDGDQDETFHADPPAG
jgi:hypothetical protein